MVTYYKIGKRKVPLWAIISINICAPFIGLALGSVLIEYFMGAPDIPAVIGPLRTGEQKSAFIDWPSGNFTGGELKMIVEVGVENTTAQNIIVGIDMMDPDDKTKAYAIARLDKFDVPRADGLRYASRVVNLIPALTSLRGTVRTFDAKRVQVRARVQQKPNTPKADGYILVTRAQIVGQSITQSR